MMRLAEQPAVPGAARLTLRQRLGYVLLWTAASLVCAVRLYSTVGLLLPQFAFAEPKPELPSGDDHVKSVASNW
jgi:hypothetical protein